MKTLIFKAVVAYWTSGQDLYCDAIMACDPADTVLVCDARNECDPTDSETSPVCEVMLTERCAMTLPECLDSTVYVHGRQLITYGCANAPRPRHLDVEWPGEYSTVYGPNGYSCGATVHAGKAWLDPSCKMTLAKCLQDDLHVYTPDGSETEATGCDNRSSGPRYVTIEENKP